MPHTCTHTHTHTYVDIHVEHLHTIVRRLCIAFVLYCNWRAPLYAFSLRLRHSAGQRTAARAPAGWPALRCVHSEMRKILINLICCSKRDQPQLSLP